MSKKISRTIMFVDYEARGFTRYAMDLASTLKKSTDNCRFIAVYMERTNVANLLGFNQTICAQDYGASAKKIIEEFAPTAIILYAHRFFDYMFTLEAHKKGILVFNFQHGLYMESTVISSLNKKSIGQLIKKKQKQIKLYLKCIYHMNQDKMAGTLKTFFYLIKYHSLYSVINVQFGKQCNADVSFIFGEYWNSYYCKQYKECASEFEVIGYPELEGNTQDTSGCFQNSLPILCYLAQTSVEDGLVPEAALYSFLDKIKRNLNRFNVIVKLHPRSNKDLYDELTSRLGHVMIWNKKEFPLADFYIGHESTVVARALYLTDKTMIYRLIPERISAFENYSKFVCKENKEFEAVLDEMIKSTRDSSVTNEFKHYVYKNPYGAINMAADRIINLI